MAESGAYDEILENTEALSIVDGNRNCNQETLTGHEVTIEEIKKEFFVELEYGKSPLSWPTRTLMVCHLYDDKENKNRAVYKNEPGKHAEKMFIDSTERLENLKIFKQPRLKIFINYSPCAKCASEISKITHQYSSVTIKFANFYKITPYNGNEDFQANQRGLYELSRNKNVTLEIFDGSEDWKEFLEYLNLDVQDVTYSKEREEREATDVEFLKVFMAKDNKDKNETETLDNIGTHFNKWQQDRVKDSKATLPQAKTESKATPPQVKKKEFKIKNKGKQDEDELKDDLFFSGEDDSSSGEVKGDSYSSSGKTKTKSKATSPPASSSRAKSETKSKTKPKL